MTDLSQNISGPASIPCQPVSVEPGEGAPVPPAAAALDAEQEAFGEREDIDDDDLPDTGEEEQVEGESSWLELLKVLVYAFAVAMFVRTFFFQPYNIPSGSMMSTLLVGDYLFVEKFSYGYSKYSLPLGRFLPSFGRVLFHSPARGDVVVFAPPNDTSTVYIKRLVGLPGDRIRMTGGVLYVNDLLVPKLRVADYVADENGYPQRVARFRETLPNGKSYDVLDAFPDGQGDNTRTYVVPAGQYFMMGDNRDNSNDSRMDVGYVPAENLVGKAQFRFFSVDEEKARLWKFWTWPRAIRFGRLFTVID
jgi:signal peptidase I